MEYQIGVDSPFERDRNHGLSMIRVSDKNTTTCTRDGVEVLFSRLATDVVHCIFELVLDLHLIHDFDFPLNALAKHRRQLFHLRCVCPTWSKFLLSSPQYWCAIDIQAPPAAARAIERVQCVPLCIYSIRPKNRMNAQYDQARALLERRLAQIHTLRSNDKAFHSFGMSLVRRGLPSLQTLEVETDDSHHWENDRADNLPRLRHLASRSWRPPSNAPWLEGLRTLQLRDIRNLSPELYQLLAACTNLRRLLLQLDDPKVGNRFLDLPFVVSFPHLTEVDLDFPDKQTAIIFMSRVKIQPSSGGSVRVRSLSTSELGGAFELFQFLTEGEQSIRPARPTSFRMDGMEMEATYKVGDRSLTLKSVHPWRADGYVDLQRVLESFNQRLNNPPAKITIQEPNSSHALLLPNFSTSNVQSIHFMGTLSFHEVLRQVLRAIGRPQNLCDTRISVSGHAMGDSEDWPFKSLRSLTIESVDGNGRVNLNDVVGLITAGDYKKRGKLGGWLKEVTFIDCILEGMSASDATTRLEALGVIMSIRTRDR